jgi:hypothetical protein
MVLCMAGEPPNLGHHVQPHNGEAPRDLTYEQSVG